MLAAILAALASFIGPILLGLVIFISSIRTSVKRFYKEGLHYIIFDTAPSVGGIQERAVWASDLVIVPTATEFLSAEGVGKVMRMMSILQHKKQWGGALLGILPTFFDEQTRESKATMDNLVDRFSPNVLTPIHRATILRECAASGQTIFETDPDSRAAAEYQVLVQMVAKY